MLLHLFGQHAGVLHGVPHEEHAAKAGGEGGFGFGDTIFGAGDFGRVPRNEVVHGLLLGQPRHGGQHAKRVAAEQHQVARVGADARNARVVDVVDWVRRARVFSHGIRVKVNGARVLVKHDILQDRAKPDGAPNFGLLRRFEADALGIAPALDVEHAVVRPAVFVVADQRARRVGRQRRLARAGQPKEQGDVARGAHVAARVEGEDAALGHEVVHHRKNAFLHFARVLRAQDDHFAGAQVHVDGRGRRHVGRVAVDGKRARVENGKVGLPKFGQLALRRPNQHVVHEQRVVRARAHDAHLDAGRRVPPRVPVKHKDAVQHVEVVDGALPVEQERVFIHFKVGGPVAGFARAGRPPDVGFDVGRAHDALVARGAPRFGAGQGGQGAGGHDVGAGFVEQGL